VPFVVRRRLLAAFRADHQGLRGLAGAWARSLGEGGPDRAAAARAALIWTHPERISRELLALRVIQTLSLIDIRNYRDLVLELGDYDSDRRDGP
jgi:hypothetical protein